jgi:hypothetical protein
VGGTFGVSAGAVMLNVYEFAGPVPEPRRELSSRGPVPAATAPSGVRTAARPGAIVTRGVVGGAASTPVDVIPRRPIAIP